MSFHEETKRNWFFLFQVCEVYHLHRETYHLAIAYVDQYLSNTSQLAKTKLQLLGITALFIAAKIEVMDSIEHWSSVISSSFSSKEIYPPRISEFAYVTDKAYHESDILEMELEIMRVRNEKRQDFSMNFSLFRR